MMIYLTALLLCIGIELITIGIHTNDSILVVIGVVLITLYNVIIYHKKD